MRYDLSVIGLGYIGLPTAALAATAGMRVLGVDINQQIVDTVRAGGVHIEEPGLAEKVAGAVKSGLLDADTRSAAADVFMIAVPTPVDHQTRRPDMRMVEAAATAIAQVALPGNLVVLQSTCPVGATADVKALIESLRPDLAGRLFFAYCPERAIPGRTMHEMTGNDRAIGGLSPADTQKALAFYRRFITGKLLETDARTAELVKLTENASRDVQIAFANELSLVCDRLGLDVWDVIRLANHHPRVNILQPGPGVGGHCLAVDPWFIVNAAPDCTPLLRTAREVNDSKPLWVVKKVQEAAQGLESPVICLLGLSYKENVDDFRESPSITVADLLIASGVGEIIIAEPYMPKSDRYTLVTLEEGLRRADIVVHLTAHDVFRSIPRRALMGKAVIDTRGRLLAA